MKPRETAPTECPTCRALPGRACVSQSTMQDMLHVHGPRAAQAAAEADLETCSECLDEVPDSVLREWRPTGERLCPDCYPARA